MSCFLGRHNELSCIFSLLEIKILDPFIKYTVLLFQVVYPAPKDAFLCLQILQVFLNIPLLLFSAAIFIEGKLLVLVCHGFVFAAWIII